MYTLLISGASLVAQMVKHLPTMLETRVWSLDREVLLEKEMAIHSSFLAWKIPWTEEPDRLQSMGSQSQTGLSDFTSFHLSFVDLRASELCDFFMKEIAWHFPGLQVHLLTKAFSLFPTRSNLPEGSMTAMIGVFNLEELPLWLLWVDMSLESLFLSRRDLRVGEFTERGLN